MTATFHTRTLLLLAYSFTQAVFAFDTSYNRTFELIGDQVCEVYAIIERPEIWESYVTENKIVTFDHCDETITVINAPTHVRTTITHKVTVDPCPPETCTDEKCHSEAKVVTETITPCKDDRCTTKTITYTITKTRTHEIHPTKNPNGECRGDRHCEKGQCCSSNYECGYGPKFCGKGCHPEKGECHPSKPIHGSCKDGKICENHSCCGKAFECGYGPEFCRKDCRPELGQCDKPDKDQCLHGEKCKYGKCCSEDYYCGKGPKFCGEGCHPDLGKCDEPREERCLEGKRCKHGKCCSEGYYCGKGPGFCGTGCHPLLGKCDPITCGTEAPVPVCPLIPTPQDPEFQYCCGAKNICGLGPKYCSPPGCQDQYGYCDVTPTATESGIPTATPTACGAGSPNPECPEIPGTDGYHYCCGMDNTCGLGPEYCDRPGCQTQYGYCNPTATTDVVPTSTATSTLITCGEGAPNPDCPVIPGTENDYQYCCGMDNTCGQGAEYCDRLACQPEYGYCYPAASTDFIPTATEYVPTFTDVIPTATDALPTATGTSAPIPCGAGAYEPECPVIPGTDGFPYCCGADNTCGQGPEYCDRPPCQPEYGYCYPHSTSSAVDESTITEPVPTATPTGPVTCGPNNLCPFIPGTEGYRYCCGPDSTCGLGDGFCDAECQPEYGYCPPAGSSTGTGGPDDLSTTTPDVPESTPQVPDSTAQPEITTTAPEPSATPSTPTYLCGSGLPECPDLDSGGSMIPGCCSPEGVCGLGDGFCDTGCQPLYGSCNPIACGPGNECPLFPIPGGSTQGCCNEGFCGVGDDFCGPGCQPQYGGVCTCGEDIGSCPSVILPFFGSTQQCCNEGKCGFGPQFCGGGCDDDYGRCYPELCGPIFGICNDASKCCGSDNRCGTGEDFCGTGCTPEYGAPCDPPPPVCGPAAGGAVCEDASECCNLEGQCSVNNCILPDCRPFGAQCLTCGPNVGDCPTAGDCCNADGDCSADNCGSADCRPFGAQCQTCGPDIGDCPNPEDCCNSAGFCGSGPSFCGAGCQPFGQDCQNCGADIGSCDGVGECCSSEGYCGTDSCGPGCQGEYGYPCDNCPFVPPPGEFLPVVILPFLVKRFCCLWYSVVSAETCGSLEARFGLGVGILEGLNPGGIPEDCIVQAGASICVKGIPPFFNIQGRNSGLFNVDGASLEGRDTGLEITGFDLPNTLFPPQFSVDLFYAPLDSTSFATQVVLLRQLLRAHTNGGTNTPPTVRGDYTSPANSFLLDCTIVDGTGLIACTADGGVYTQFSMCDTPLQPNRRNLCLGTGDDVGNWVANLDLYAVAAT